MSINNATISGRLTRDPEMRTTTTGKQVVSFSVAVDDNYNKEHTDFFNVTAWGKTAEFVENFLTKGRLVGVEGRLKQSRWTDKEGNNRDGVEIVASSVSSLDSPSDKKDAPKPASQDGDFDPFDS